jgi:hypothetical protein
MAREPHPTDFTVPVDGIGTFTFARRRMQEEIKLQAEYARMIDGTTPTQWLELVAGWIAALKVLTVRAPDGWNIEDMDPLDNETYRKLGVVHKALTDKERSFRTGTSAAGEASGQAAGGVG